MATAATKQTIPIGKLPDNSNLEFLCDLSPRDQTADTHKGWAETMSTALDAAGLQRPSVRVRDCAESMFFNMRSDLLGEMHLKLSSTPYCHYRHCPTCQWRRSLKNKAIVMSALPKILERFPTARFAMLTLTVRNCPVGELRETILAMNAGWNRLIKRENWPADGWIRAVEVTRGADGSAHPHYHVLLMLPASYFGAGYVSTRVWVQRWRQAMRLDYDPICDIRQIRAKAVVIEATAVHLAPAEGAPAVDARLAMLTAAVSEVVKYACKTENLLSGGPDWLATYIEQVHGLKFMTSGGELKGMLKDVRNEETEDLVHVGGDDEEGGGDIVDKLVFHWRTKHKRYARIRRMK